MMMHGGDLGRGTTTCGKPLVRRWWVPERTYVVKAVWFGLVVSRPIDQRDQITCPQVCVSKMGTDGAQEKVQRADSEPDRWMECLNTMKVLGKDKEEAEAVAADSETP